MENTKKLTLSNPVNTAHFMAEIDIHNKVFVRLYLEYTHNVAVLSKVDLKHLRDFIDSIIEKQD